MLMFYPSVQLHIQLETRRWGNSTTWPILGVLIFLKFGARGAPTGVSICGVRQGVSEFLRVVYAKPLIICYDFAAVWSFIFGLPLLAKGCP